MINKTIVPHIQGVYSSFPTMIIHGTDLFIYYRQGKACSSQVHGLHGRVRCFEINLNLMMEKISSSEDSLFSYGTDRELAFCSENELDSICSDLGDGYFSLATRTYLAGKINQPYVSFSQGADFNARIPVVIDQLQSLIFYGKAFKSSMGYLLPAYGRLKSDLISRPLVLTTYDFRDFRLLAKLPSKIQGSVVLNEHSIVDNEGQFVSFIRQDSKPFGIWMSKSDNLLTWTKPVQLYEKAHAPIAINISGKIFLAFRDLSEKGMTRVRLSTPFDNDLDVILDTYSGNPYDGGYVYLCQAGKYLLAVYYLGNEQGEP